MGFLDKLKLFVTGDKFNITGSADSLNENISLIAEKIDELDDTDEILLDHAVDDTVHLIEGERELINYLEGVTGNVQMQLDNKTQHIDLTGQIQTGQNRSVIALCKTTEANTTNGSFSSGSITFYRHSGWSKSTSKIDFTISGDYSFANYITSGIMEYGNSANASVKPCVFTYNGETYGGIEVYIDSASSDVIFFDGTTNFDIFGVDYYDVGNNVTLNEEINNSIDYTKIRPLSDVYYNCNKLVYSDIRYSWDININGKAQKAVNDKDGNEITSTYSRQGVVLWENTYGVNKTDFLETVELKEDISNYNYYEIEYCIANTNTDYHSTRFTTGRIRTSAKTKLIMPLDYNYVRDVSAPSGITLAFGNCIKYLTYGADAITEDANKYVVPIHVIGYKTL